MPGYEGHEEWGGRESGGEAVMPYPVNCPSCAGTVTKCSERTGSR